MCNRLVDPTTERVKDMSKWLNYLAYDIMGEIVFGRGFDMLIDEQLHYILPLIDNMVFSFLLVFETTSLLIFTANDDRVVPCHGYTNQDSSISFSQLWAKRERCSSSTVRTGFLRELEERKRRKRQRERTSFTGCLGDSSPQKTNF